MRKIIIVCAASFTAVALCCGFLVLASPEYAPSQDGVEEQHWALEDMRAHCKCDDILLVEKIAPVAGFSYREKDGHVEKLPSPGSWSFVFKLSNGTRFSANVLPFGSAPVFVGRYSEIVEMDT